ncbi:MAG: class I SAM-dependent methyltransferase [Desulfobaccales bacterium]
MPYQKESERLEKIATQYDPEADWEEIKILLKTAELIGRHAKDSSFALELGVSTGFMTEQLCKLFERMVCVDGSKRYIDMTKERLTANALKRIDFEVALFEEYEPKQLFPNIIMSHIIEHVEDPIAILSKYKQFLTKDGVIHIAVPNAASLNRRIGFMLCLMEKIDQLSEKDHLIGHRRLYTYEMLLDHIKASGLEVVVCEGIFLKPLSKGQMAHWKDELIDAFFEIGRELPAYSMDIYVLARPRV